MSLFDIFNKKHIGETLGSLMDTAKEQASGLTKATPGGVGGLVGAGALGALLGSFMSKGALQNAALVGAGAVAWNFYQKWSQSQKESQPAEPAPVQQPVAAVAPAELDPTARLLLRAMVFAARADGHIDATEQERISKVVAQMAPGQDTNALLGQLLNAPIDPAALAAEIRSAEQGEDLYRLSCMIVDIDHFMERSYLDALAAALKISEARKGQLEEEARQAKADANSGVGNDKEKTQTYELPKKDANGNEVHDAQGNVVYETVTETVPKGNNATFMSQEMVDYMDAHGLAYDKTGGDYNHSSDEWDVAITALESRLEELGTNTQQEMVYVQDYMGQYNSYLQGANTQIANSNQTLTNLARGQ